MPYSGTKISNFNELLTTGVDIAVTHVTFLNAAQETLDLIRTGNYTLIVDEALDVVTDFNKVQSVESASRQSITKDDIDFLLARDIIRIASDNRVVWLGGEYGSDFKFSEVQRYAGLNRLYCVDNKLLLAVFPPEMFTCFKAVYIMTYLFAGSIFKYYLDLFDIQYEIVSVCKDGTQYCITGDVRQIDAEFRVRCRELIQVCDSKALNNYKGNALSKAWFDRSSSDDRLAQLSGHISYFFRHYTKDARARNGDIMWTCFGCYEDKVKGHGFTAMRALTREEYKLPPAALEARKKALSCFLSCNAKSTNAYRNRWALAYCVNIYYNPMIRRFFTDNNVARKGRGLSEIYPDEDLYALSCMIQWTFRSRIRDGESIYIYIPSQRMRNLMLDWMNCRI